MKYCGKHRCEKCGKYMRHKRTSSAIDSSKDKYYPDYIYITDWECVCGVREQEIIRKKAVFHRDAIGVVQYWDGII